MASEIYDKYFKVAQAQPRGVVAKLGAIVAQIDRACQKQVSVNYRLRLIVNEHVCFLLLLKQYLLP